MFQFLASVEPKSTLQRVNRGSGLTCFIQESPQSSKLNSDACCSYRDEGLLRTITGHCWPLRSLFKGYWSSY